MQQRPPPPPPQPKPQPKPPPKLAPRPPLPKAPLPKPAMQKLVEQQELMRRMRGDPRQPAGSPRQPAPPKEATQTRLTRERQSLQLAARQKRALAFALLASKGYISIDEAQQQG